MRLYFDTEKSIWADLIFGLSFHIRSDAFGYAIVLTFGRTDYALVLDKEGK